MAYGLTATGFNPKDLNIIFTELKAAFKASLGPNLNTDPDSAMGNFCIIISALLAECWELGEGVNGSFDRDSATGESLVNVAGLTGLFRKAAIKTGGEVEITGTSGTSIPSGTTFENLTTKDRFEVTQSVTISASGKVTAQVEALEDGPIEAAQNTVTGISTPIAGMDSVTNLTDFVPGAYEELDSELRARIPEQFEIGGASVDGAIKADLLKIPGVQEAFVRSNRSLTTDNQGIPGKAFRCVIWPASGTTSYQNAIAQTVFESQPAGIESDGLISIPIVDEEGEIHDIKYSFAQEHQISVTVHLDVNSLFPSSGEAEVETLLNEFLDALKVGEDLRWMSVIPALETIPGIDNILVTFLDSTAGISVINGNISIAFDAIGVRNSVDAIINP